MIMTGDIRISGASSRVKDKFIIVIALVSCFCYRPAPLPDILVDIRSCTSDSPSDHSHANT